VLFLTDHQCLQEIQGSGESEIRKWIIENDWLETIVQLPDRMFFNTGITTYLWIVTNKKPSNRKGKIQLIDGSEFYDHIKKNLGDKSKEINDTDKNKILKTYLNYEENEISKIFENDYFCYTKVQIEQPLKKNGEVVKLKNGTPKPDTKLRGHERIPLNVSIEKYFEQEVKPYLPNSWMDRSKDKIGYEINFVKEFFKYKKLKDLNFILKEIETLNETIESNLKNL
jgi:type I restriction enzyme M protein